MEYLYHGSAKSGIKKLEPHKSTHGNYVYATPHKELAIIFAGRAGDDMTYSLFKTTSDQPWQLVERIPRGLETMFNNSASIYTLSSDSFQDIKTGFVEVVSKKDVDIIREEEIENVYQKIKQLQEEGLIKIYHYPNRPANIPLDDTDLIETEVRQANREKGPLTHETFERLLFLHPNLLEKVNLLACTKDPNFIPFSQEDLITIFDKFIILQMLDPSKEQFISSALTQYLKYYPEFSSILQEKLEIFQKSKEEKILFLFDTYSKFIKNIPQELIETEKMRCLQDNRSFIEIGLDIYDIYTTIRKMESLVNKQVSDDVLNNSIILIGPLGAGKSTISNHLASTLDMPKISLDNRKQLSYLYQQRKNFKNNKEFEFFLTGSVLTNLSEPTIIDFGAGHSIYENPIMFLEIQQLIQQFHNVVLLMPSTDKEESLTILNQRKKIEEGSNQERDNRHFLSSHCNYALKTITQYTKEKSPEEITSELLSKLHFSKQSNSNIHK